MALLPSAVASSTFRPVNPSLLRHQMDSASCAPSQHVSYRPTRKLVVAQFRIPDKAMVQINAFKEQLRESLPDSIKELPWKKAKDQLMGQINAFEEQLRKSLPESIKEFPWKKAKDPLLERLASLSEQVFKWSFISWFFLSFLSDILFAFSKNQELVMPVGLFVGCLLSDFMKETSEELFQQTQAKSWNLVGIAGFFVILKLLSVFFGVRGQIFLLQVANGGLMQILWLLWKQYQGDDAKNVDNA